MANLETGSKEQADSSCPTKRMIVVAAVVTVCLLAAVAVVTWLIVAMYDKKTHTNLYHVQVTQDEHLAIYDPQTDVWRLVCSSSSNGEVARLGCEQMGFVRTIVSSESQIEDMRQNRTAQFYCVNEQLLSLAETVHDALFPCSCQSRLALSVQCQDCGRRKLSADRIVGGLPASLGNWPWQVSLRFDGTPICGGSLVTEEWIVTAAHCFPERNRFPARWVVVSGVVSQQNARVQTPVQTVVYHAGYRPFFEPGSEDNSNDIALLQLESPLNFSDYIQPLCLPAVGQSLVEGSLCTVTGWGNTEYYGQQSDVLREAQVPILSNAQCNTPEYFDNQVTPKMFCAGYSEGGVDACQGDSGGPLACQDNLSNSTRWRLCGIVSWGTGCGLPNKPGVYCRVTEYHEWLHRTMKVYRNLNGIYSTG